MKGHGAQQGHVERYRGGGQVVEFLPKLKVELLTEDHKASQIVEAIRGAARTGRVGDGRVFVLPVDEVVRIRTGERGSGAI